MNRLQPGLHRDRRPRRDGAADGVGGAARWCDAQRVHRPARRNVAELGEPEWCISRAPRPCPPGGCSCLAVGDDSGRHGVRRWSAVTGSWRRCAGCSTGRSAGGCRGRHRRTAGYRQEPSGPRGRRDSPGRRGGEVFSTFCESMPAMSRFMRWPGLFARQSGVDRFDAEDGAVRMRARSPMPTRGSVLLDDLLGIARPGPPARHRSRCAPSAADRPVECGRAGPSTPAVYVIEDAHWIDDVSEAMLAEFLSVVAQTPVAGADHLSARVPRRADRLRRERRRSRLQPLADSQTTALCRTVGHRPVGRRVGDVSWTARRVTRSSPRRSCAIWPSAAYSR